MTDNPPDRRTLRVLRSVRKIEPAGDATGRALDRALATAQRLERTQHRPNKWKRVIMRSGIAAAILIAAAVVGWGIFANGEALAAPTWADVARQTAGIGTAHLDARTYRGGKLAERYEFWIKSGGLIRQRDYELVDGKMVATKGAIATPDAAVRWSERTRLAERVSTDNPYMAQAAAARTMEAVLGLSLLAEKPDPSITINGEYVKFVPGKQKHPADPTLRGFSLQPKASSAPPLPGLFAMLVYWFDGRSNTLRRITISQGEQRCDMAVELGPKLPEGWFKPDIPKGFVDAGAGVRPRLPEDVRAVYDHVAAARARFGDYRAVIWRDRTGGWPTHRESARGDQWRCDVIDWTTMYSAMQTGKNPRGYVKISPDGAFAKVWGQVTRDDYSLDMTAMTRQGRYAIIHYHLSGQGPRVSATLYDQLDEPGYARTFGPTLRFVAWPEWVSWEDLHSSGRDLREPLLRWRLLPADPAHPERVDVVGERKVTTGLSCVRYTFDRDKDWLCVRKEKRSAPRTEVWTIEEAARTPDGFWVPRRVTSSNPDYSLTCSVRRGPAKSEFFSWPKGIPQAVEAYAVLRSIQRPTSQPGDPPDAAKGK